MTIPFISLDPHPGYLNCLKEEIIGAMNYCLKSKTHHTDFIIYYHLRGILYLLVKNMNCQNAALIAKKTVLSHSLFNFQ